jgi:hypothetical protein
MEAETRREGVALVNRRGARRMSSVERAQAPHEALSRFQGGI